MSGYLGTVLFSFRELLRVFSRTLLRQPLLRFLGEIAVLDRTSPRLVEAGLGQHCNSAGRDSRTGLQPGRPGCPPSTRRIPGSRVQIQPSRAERLSTYPLDHPSGSLLGVVAG